ncbi:MAG: hypothetical protein EBT26_05305 [Microbacteriaceae bacterium]|nr:hypothetical protein [Microbacteriaceae bacterium]NBS61443.1 hypothetical protein [Microbacteriaceae bacterium]
MYQVHVNMQFYKLAQDLQEATSIVTQAMLAHPGQPVTIIPVESLDDQIIYNTPLPEIDISTRMLTAEQLAIVGGFQPVGQDQPIGLS